MAVLLCDRKAPGLPIVATNAAFHKLTGFPPRESIGYNCREVLQGPGTEPESVRQLSDAVKHGRGCRVLLTNYRHDGSLFVNQVSLSATLRLAPGSELIAAVIQAKPTSLEHERSTRRAAEVIAAFESCGVAEVSSGAPADAADAMPPEASQGASGASDAGSSAEIEEIEEPLIDPKSIRVGWQWLVDAETAFRKAMRLPLLRTAFLWYVLHESRPRPDDDNERLHANSVSIDNVRLMLHSENVLSEQGDYVRMACELWAEMEELKNMQGYEFKAAVAGIRKRFVIPERGAKRHAVTWMALRKLVFDPLAQSERELGVSVELSMDQPPVDLAPAVKGDGRRTHSTSRPSFTPQAPAVQPHLPHGR